MYLSRITYSPDTFLTLRLVSSLFIASHNHSEGPRRQDGLSGGPTVLRSPTGRWTQNFVELERVKDLSGCERLVTT